MNLVYPQASGELTQILSDLAVNGRVGRVGLDLFPPVNKKSHHIRWVQADNFFGLQQMRGIDGVPPHVQRLGNNVFVFEPNVYGEHILIGERELLTRASPMNPEMPIPIGELISEADQLLVNRELDRMEYNAWQLATTGTLQVAVSGPTGPVTYKDSYTLQTYTAPIAWVNASTATPLINIQTAQQLSVGHGASFGADATIYMNQVTLNRLLNNSNTADFGGRRGQAGATLNSLPQFNSYFQGQNLPQIVVYDRGYQPLPQNGPLTTPSSQFQKFIPDGIAILVGKRPNGDPVGQTQMTINAMNPDLAPGPYRFIKDFAQGLNAPREVPPRLEIHRGWNGGIALLYPSAIVVMTV